MKSVCTSREFKMDISELCEKCPLAPLIVNGIENQIIKQANVKKELLSKDQFQRYVDSEIENATSTMQRMFLIEQQNKGYKNDPHRANRIKTYIWNKERIKALNQILNPTVIVRKTKFEILDVKLEECGFKNLEKVKCFSREVQNKLIKLLSNNQLPYQIAMLDYLGFLDFVYGENGQIKTALNKEIARILDSEERGVKGNISVLSEHSNENRSRYTAFNYKEIVKKDYDKLK